ncbi:MAG: HAMP domain-containing histidine kinase [Saprospiraceae bacterium]|nr:HAMP domain-containing histidine kinase [Saprospiraceae bacterium]
MNKRLLYLLGTTLALFVIAQSLSWWVSRPGLPHYAEKIGEYLQLQEGKLQRYFQNEDFFIDLSGITDRKLQTIEQQNLTLLKAMAKEEFVVYVLEGDSILAWNHNSIRLPDKWLPSQLHAPGPIFASSRSGFFSLYYKDIVHSQDTLTLLAAIPIKKVYPTESPYLSSGFTADLLMPSAIELSSGEGVPVKNNQGQVFCFLKSDRQLIDPVRQIWVLTAFGLAFLLLSFSFNKVAIIIGKKYHFLYGLAIVLFTALGIRHAILRLLFGQESIWNLFTANLALEGWNKSLIDLLISSLLLFWTSTFFHREFVPFYKTPREAWKRWILGALGYLSVLTAITLTNFQFKFLVLDSALQFDFQTIFSLDVISFAAICSLLLSLIALFIFSHRIMLSVLSLGLNRKEQAAIAILSVFVSLPVLGNLDLSFHPVMLYLIGLIFILGLELFIESKVSSLTWLVFWIFLCAGYAMVLLVKYEIDRNQNTQLYYAKTLADPSDHTAEPYMSNLGQEIRRDTALISHLQKQVLDTLYEHPDWQKLVDQKVIEKGYLFNNYQSSFYVFANDQRPPRRFTSQASSVYALYKDTSAVLATGFPNLSLIPSYDKAANYLYVDSLYLGPDSSATTFVVSFQFNKPTPSRVYTELLLDAPYKGLKDLSSYNYEVFEGRRSVFSDGTRSEGLLGKAQKLEPDTFGTRFTSARSEIYYLSKHKLIAIIGKSMGGYTKPWSLFSFLFALFILMVLLLTFIDFWFPCLPPGLGFRLQGRQSLRNRIQLAVIALILGSFLIIGIVTVTFFSQSSDRYHDSRLTRKVNAIQEDLQRDLAKYPVNWPKDFDLGALVRSTSNIHKMDINYFDMEGRLLSSSTRFIFDRNIVAPLMNPVALKSLKQPTTTSQFLDEKLGKLTYKTAYVTLRNGQKEIKAYLGLPYYSEGRNLRTDLYDFMGTILNVYVLLLLVAGVIAIVVANSVTEPIAKIGEKLSRFDLGQSEPLEWKNKDEIGQLIAEYNQMIRKLEESTAKLKQSEREGAWREMAKQVAHEIKNPLTPMKLGIQHLLRVQQTQPERAAEMLDKMAGNLIEQIENLSRIASEFSNFAKMPKANRQVVALNEVVNSVYQIFKETPDGSDLLYMELPDEPIEVFADKGQIIQVLNNLIKNAIQAIPDDRKGKITLKLIQKEEIATVLVKDNGSGIPENMIERVFSPNFTTKTSGMGLGLAISKNIIDATGGRIYFTTKTNKGTTFYIELPIYKE